MEPCSSLILIAEQVWEVEILPDGSHTFTIHKLSAAMVPGHVMTERRVVVVG